MFTPRPTALRDSSNCLEPSGLSLRPAASQSGPLRRPRIRPPSLSGVFPPPFLHSSGSSCPLSPGAVSRRRICPSPGGKCPLSLGWRPHFFERPLGPAGIWPRNVLLVSSPAHPELQAHRLPWASTHLPCLSCPGCPGLLVRSAGCCLAPWSQFPFISLPKLILWGLPLP